MRGLIVGAIVVLGAAVAAWWLWPNGESTGEMPPPQARQRIKEATSARAPAARTNAVAVAADTNRAQRVGEVRNGYVLLPDGTLHRRRGLKKVKVGVSNRAKTSIFDHGTDNEFAALVSLKPGESLIGGPLHHGGDYTAAFLKSLETPIIVTKDDTAEVKELKRAVIEARKAMKDAIDAGEDPRKVMQQAYDDARKLSTYKSEIRSQVNKLLREGDYTDKDIDDLIGAANKMLESKGIAPMNLGPIAKTRLKIKKQ